MTADDIKPRSRWVNANDRGNDPRVARVMAVSEGWVMYRFKNAAPVLRYWKEFLQHFKPAGDDYAGR